MAQSDKEKRTEVLNHTVETLQKLVLGFIPNGHVVDVLNYRSNLKQKRVISFSESLKDTLEKISGKDLNLTNFTTEEFIDVFDSVINLVQNTNSVYKLQRFHNIVIKQIIEPSPDADLIKRFLHTIGELSDIQLLMLSIIQKCEVPPGMIEVHEALVSHGINISVNGVASLSHDDHTIESGLVMYYVVDLINRGLIDEIDGQNLDALPNDEIRSNYRWLENKRDLLAHTKNLLSNSAYAKRLIDYTLNPH